MSNTEFYAQNKNCLICGSDNLRSFKAKAYDSESLSFVNIIECKNCIFGWQYPLGRTEQQSVQHFETAYADAGRSTSQYYDENRKREIAKLEFEFISKLPVKNRHLLDIGAGAGIFAEVAAENNWTVTAVDPAIELNRLKNFPRINAIKGTTAQIPNGKLFDVVTLWDVIEHVTNPVEVIQDAQKYLKEGGWLVLETGNYKSADRLYGGMNHWIYQLDHRWYFSPESLEQLLSDSGFSNFIFSEKVLRPNWNGTVSYAGPSRAQLLKTIAKDPLHFPRHLSTYFDLIRAKKWEMSGIGIFAISARKPIKVN